MKLQQELISRNFYVIFAGYPLRPELIESAMYLYKATRDPFLLSLGEDMLDSIEYSAKTPCGYATVKDVRDHTLEDRMESFFLSETTKYMYLLFDVDNEIIHKHKEHVVKTPFGECVVESGGWIFNTEAHPIGTYRIFVKWPNELFSRNFYNSFIFRCRGSSMLFWSHRRRY